MTDEEWIIDTEPSSRFPVYTRLNANDVMADPITPLGASLVWIPEVLPGWGIGYVQQDAFTPAEVAAEAVAPVGGFIYGHLYINQTAVRVIGIRSGIGSDAIDAAFFPHPDAPKHEPSDADVNEELSSPAGCAHPVGIDHHDVPARSTRNANTCPGCGRCGRTWPPRRTRSW